MQNQVLRTLAGFSMEIKKDIISFLFPEICSVCKIQLPDKIHHICFSCDADLHYTYFEKYQESSPLDELFWGRVQLFSTHSLLYFSKSNSTQKIVHQIKYKNNQALAIEMGKRMGEKLLIKWRDNVPDVIIPVPLHPKKHNKRGYNQSELLAKGLSIQTKTPYSVTLLKRRKNTKTQTKKGKMERWDNVNSIFEVNSPEKWKNKHLCIIDDVITTGSTIEACAIILQQAVENCKVSIVSLAFAK